MTKRKNTYVLTLLILTIQLSEQCSKSEKEIHGGVRWVYSLVVRVDSGHAKVKLTVGFRKLNRNFKDNIHHGLWTHEG